jgi:hypothetical protein
VARDYGEVGAKARAPCALSPALPAGMRGPHEFGRPSPARRGTSSQPVCARDAAPSARDGRRSLDQSRRVLPWPQRRRPRSAAKRRAASACARGASGRCDTSPAPRRDLDSTARGRSATSSLRRERSFGRTPSPRLRALLALQRGRRIPRILGYP